MRSPEIAISYYYYYCYKYYYVFSDSWKQGAEQFFENDS